MSEKNCPRFLLAAPSSGSGKTLVTCGILQALLDRGLSVASFKCGPDYIDPMFHEKVIGAKSRNLDTFFAGDGVVRGLLSHHAAGCEISVIEGVMGYYDGLAGISTRASAYDVARATQTPVVLLVNGRGMSVSCVALIGGFLSYREDSRIEGVIFNRISPSLYPRLKEMTERELGIRAFGYVPQLEDGAFDSRHLGLVMPEEIPGIRGRLRLVAEKIEQSVDLDGLLALAHGAPPLPGDGFFPPEKERGRADGADAAPLRIAVARDRAFCFLYEDNLDLLRRMGVGIEFFSPLDDASLPEGADGLILPGGYPELYARALSENTAMRAAVAEAIRAGLPYLAECGGFLYLHDEMEDMEGNFRPMAGVIGGRAFRREKLGRFGYITLEGGTCFGRDVGPIPAHEFHYYDSDACGGDYLAQKPLGGRQWRCVRSLPTGWAGFPHLYFYGNEKVPAAFLDACRIYKTSRGAGGASCR